ncbi:MAG: hypothetical protein EU536_04415 [Promethearchaeota archaeon]|nr:MAG: hypothetical protein EU536_04415 [Candidatus Lokiarchaeota archaeon]
MPQNLDPSYARVLQFQVQGATLGGVFFLNDSTLPTILLFHGNGELAFEYQYFTSMFFECGVNLAVVDYRGYGFSTGRPAFSQLFTDALPIYEQFTSWINTQDLNPSLFLLGRSLGSICAAEIGSHNPPTLRGVIFESGIGSAHKILTDLFGVNIPDDLLPAFRQFSNDHKASQIRKPVLIIHGTKDSIVPSEHAQTLFDALPSDIDKKLVYIRGAGHNDIFNFHTEYFTPLKQFIMTNK